MLSTENNNKDMIKMIDMTKKKRVVVKVGTSTLTHSTGLLNIRRVEQLVKTLADLQNAGHEIILVSSGAVGLGRAKLGIKERPKDTPTRQLVQRWVSVSLCIFTIIFSLNTALMWLSFCLQSIFFLRTDA